MDEKALFLKFWEKEAPATRKVISRIPQEQSDYRADPKARTAREIAWLIVHEEIALVEALGKPIDIDRGRSHVRDAWRLEVSCSVCVSPAAP